MPPIESRKNHHYSGERVTPLEEIPEKFRKRVPLRTGGFQVIDTRLCYNWEPPKDGKSDRLVECGSVATHADD